MLLFLTVEVSACRTKGGAAVMMSNDRNLWDLQMWVPECTPARHPSLDPVYFRAVCHICYSSPVQLAWLTFFVHRNPPAPSPSNPLHLLLLLYFSLDSQTCCLYFYFSWQCSPPAALLVCQGKAQYCGREAEEIPLHTNHNQMLFFPSKFLFFLIFLFLSSSFLTFLLEKSKHNSGYRHKQIFPSAIVSLFILTAACSDLLSISAL